MILRTQGAVGGVELAIDVVEGRDLVHIEALGSVALEASGGSSPLQSQWTGGVSATTAGERDHAVELGRSGLSARLLFAEFTDSLAAHMAAQRRKVNN